MEFNIVCAWCGKLMHKIPGQTENGAESALVSHSICHKCVAKVQEEAKSLLENNTCEK